MSSDKYLAMPEVPYASDMVVCLDDETFFYSQDEVEGYAEEEGISVDKLDLIVCEPNYAWQIDPDDHYSDIMPEDQCIDDIAPGLAKAFKALNEYIKTFRPVISWEPGSKRTRLTP